MAWEEKGEWDEAVADYTRALDLNPGSYISYAGRGRARLAQDDWGAAVGDFDKSLSLQPTQPLTYLNRGIAKICSQGKTEEARSDFERYLAQAPAMGLAIESRAPAVRKWRSGETMP